MHIEKFEEKVIEESAVAAFHLVWEIVKEAGHLAWEHNEIRRAMSEYTQSYAARHGFVKILGMNEPIALREIYTAVQTIKPDFLRQFVSIEEMETAFVGDTKRGFSRIQEKTPGL